MQKVGIAQEEDGAKDLHIIEEESVGKPIQASEEDSDTKSHQSEENGSFFGLGDVGLSLFYYSVIPVPVSAFPFLSRLYLYIIMHLCAYIFS